MNHFLDASVLFHILWIIPMMGGLFLYAQKRRKRILISIFGSDNSPLVLVSERMRYLRFYIEIAIVIFLMLALARPFWGYSPRKYQSHAVDVMFAIDNSQRMLSRDLKPSRIKHIKWFVKKVAEGLPQGRLGLVSFSRVAYKECPLTADLLSFNQAVDELSIETIGISYSNIAGTVDISLKSLANTIPTSAVFILITDGYGVSDEALRAVAGIKDTGVSFIVIGVGDCKLDVPSKLYSNSSGSEKCLRGSKNGKVSFSFNESALKELAKSGGGYYFHSTSSNPKINDIKSIIGGLYKNTYLEGDINMPVEYFYYPLFVAFILSLLWFVIPIRNDPKTLKLILLQKYMGNNIGRSKNVIILLIYCGLNLLCSNLGAGEKLDIIQYNSALKLALSDDYTKARKTFIGIINNPTVSKQLLARSLFNIGVISQLEAMDKINKATEDGFISVEIRRDIEKQLKLSQDMYKRALEFDVNIQQYENNLALINKNFAQLASLKVASSTEIKYTEERQKIQTRGDLSVTRDSGKARGAVASKSETSSDSNIGTDSIMTPELLLESLIQDEKSARAKYKRANRVFVEARIVEKEH